MEAAHKESLEQRLKRPGMEVEIDEEIEEELRNNIQQDLTFFGGHPKSLEKQQAELIFRLEIEEDRKNKLYKLSPCQYNVCQKTDGWRYILIVAQTGQCYFVSRNTKGEKMPVFFKVNIAIAPNFAELPPQQPLQNKRNNYNRIVEILDGELVVDTIQGPSPGSTKEKLRYLIFDTLVHLRRDVRDLDFIKRLECAELFLRNNEFSLQWKGSSVSLEDEPQIEMFVKDFFDLDGRKERQLEFVFKTYIKAMNHKNDGVIFNKKFNAVYKLGKNEGYLKWKPPELNTIDFLLVPNDKWISEDQSNQTDLEVVDLYLQWNDSETGTYRSIFYQFMVVKREQYNTINRIWEQLMSEKDEKVDGVIAECNFVRTPADYKPIYQKLYSARHTIDDIRELIMRASDSDEQNRQLKRLQNLTYENHWNVVKFRQDKNTANALKTAENIVRTISENLSEDKLIERANKYHKERTEKEREIERKMAG